MPFRLTYADGRRRKRLLFESYAGRQIVFGADFIAFLFKPYFYFSEFGGHGAFGIFQPHEIRAYLYPFSARRGEFFDLWANDQDFALYYILRTEDKTDLSQKGNR